MKRLKSMTASTLSSLLKTKEITALELTQAYLKQISDRDSIITAYLTTCAENAIETAKSIDKRRMQGEQLPDLAGIPMALKDNICTKGIRTTCASRMLSDFIPPYSATVYSRLKQNGAVLLGKLNMDEFAMGATTENSAFGITRNPIDPAFVPGGSSGGSAAAVAAEEAVYTLGTDTGGSVRQPASFCGAVGLLPTYGRVSRYGLIAYACSLDQIGIVTKDVRDNAMVLQAIAGKDVCDFTSADAAVPDYGASLCADVSHLRIGAPKDVLSLCDSAEVGQAVLQSLERFKQLGAQLVELPLSMPDFALPAYYILVCSEASSNLARYDGVRYGHRAAYADDLQSMYSHTRGEGFGSEVKHRILVGTYLLGDSHRQAYYEKALQVRQQVKRYFADSFAKCDLILTPTAPVTAHRLGETSSEPMQMYRSDRFTVPASLAGLPAISVPCGVSKEGLPIGMQLIAPAFREDLLYRAAYAFEQEGGNGTV